MAAHPPRRPYPRAVEESKKYREHCEAPPVMQEREGGWQIWEQGWADSDGSRIWTNGLDWEDHGVITEWQLRKENA